MVLLDRRISFNFALREIKCPEQAQPQKLINTYVMLCVNRISPEEKNWFPEVLCIFLNTAGANARQFALRKILLSLAIQIQPEQLSLECPSSSEKYCSTLQEEPHFVALSDGATYHGNGAPERTSCCQLTTTLEQIALWEILLLEEIQD
jgi:hypothetical protein